MEVRRLWSVAAVFAMLWLALLAPVPTWSRADDPPPASSAGKPAAESTPIEGAAADKNLPLPTSQDLISRRFKRFEETLIKIAESMRKSDPDRAELLLRAIGKSKEDRIGTQLNDLVQLLQQQRFGDAIERQGDVIVNMQALLDLLLSEDRHKELKEEQARLKKYIEELNRIIGKEKANRADNERGVSPEEVAGQQKKIANQTGDLGKNIAKDDAAKQAKSKAESDAQSKEGKPGDGKSEDGKPSDGKPKEGDPKEGKPNEGKPEDKPSDAKPGEGKPNEGKPNEGKPSEGKPSEGKPSEGKPSEGKPSEGKPSEGKPSEGKPSEGQPSEGKPQEGSQQPQDKTPGRDEIEKAKEAMERAIEQLKKNKRHEASDEQDEAIANLQKAKDKLEEILRQLREEERTRFLAALEARFQRMLAMQLLVLDGTVKLDKVPEAERESRHQTRSLQLARQEEEIAIEASKAITLLREEGSAVAFPEAVEQMRDDMRLVVARLERTDVGELTQAVEREIIDALEEMIEALQKEMEKNKDKKDQQQQQQEGQKQDPPLVDQLAELKMLRTLQQRVNHRTKRLGRVVDGEQAVDPDVVGQLQNLADRQARIQKATYDLATGKNK